MRKIRWISLSILCINQFEENKQQIYKLKKLQKFSYAVEDSEKRILYNSF
jgi:hypothetical protein